MNQRGVLAGAGVGMTISALMQTLLANATPRIVAELDAQAWYGFVAGSYLLLSLVTLPVFAQVADRVGTRRVFLFGHVLFGLGALGVALSPGIGLLLISRAVQGIGAGAIVPSAIGGIGLVFDGAARGQALARLAIVQVAANAVGPPLGGWFTDGPGWRVGMIAVLPLSLVALALARGFPTANVPEGWWRIDLCAQWRLWRNSGLGTTGMLALLVGAAGVGLVNYAPLLLQELHGLRASITGWLLAPMLIGAGIGTGLAAKLIDRTWTRPGAWGCLVAGAVGALFPNAFVVACALGLAGIGMGATLPLLLLDAQASVAREHIAQASGLVQFGRNAGAAVAVPTLSTWLVVGLSSPLALRCLFATITAVAFAGFLLTRKASS